MALTYEQFMALALEHYNEGGDCVYECWEEYQFDDYVYLFGPITEEQALKIFNTYKNLD
jgi:hypothetical protein